MPPTQPPGRVSTTRDGSFQALGSYKSENGSLLLMQAFLYGISALVIVAFLTVWTVQRTRDIAVLKALGGSSGYVLRDAMVQAAFVLLAGAAAGGAAGVAGGVLAAGAAPFLLTPQTTLLPIAGIVVLGPGRRCAGGPEHHPGGSAPGPGRQLAHARTALKHSTERHTS